MFLELHKLAFPKSGNLTGIILEIKGNLLFHLDLRSLSHVAIVEMVGDHLLNSLQLDLGWIHWRGHTVAITLHVLVTSL